MAELQTSIERNHYETLQVPRSASKVEIQSAFRRLVKIYHPDKNPRRIPWAETRMHELLRAYEVISDDLRRRSYDRTLRETQEPTSLVERLARKKDDPGAQSKLVLHHLLTGQYEDAVDLHEQLLLRWVAFNLGDHLEERDYLDSLFLLGEAYENRRQWRTAARYYWEAYEREKSGPRKRYFFEELKDRLRVLFSQRLVQGLSPQDALKNYQRALPLCIVNRDAAIIYKKIAALYSRLGQCSEAVKALDRAQRLCPGMKAIEAMKKRIAGN